MSAPGLCARPDRPWEGPDYFHPHSEWNVDLMRVLGGQKAEVPIPDFQDAYETQRVLKLELAELDRRIDLSPEEMQEMRQSLLDETKTELSKVLTPAQVERYLHGTPDQPSIVFPGREVR